MRRPHFECMDFARPPSELFMDAGSFERQLAQHEADLKHDLALLEAAPPDRRDPMQILALAARLAGVRQEQAMAGASCSSLTALVLDVPTAVAPARREISWTMVAACAGLLVAGAGLLVASVPSSAEGSPLTVQAGY